MKRTLKKGVALLTAALLLLTVFPLTVFAASGKIVMEPVDDTTFRIVAVDYYGLQSYNLTLTAEGIEFTSFDKSTDATQSGLAGNAADFVGNPKTGYIGGLFEHELWTADAYAEAAQSRGKTLSESFDPSRFVLGLVSYKAVGEGVATVTLTGTADTSGGKEDLEASLQIELPAASSDLTDVVMCDVDFDGVISAMDARLTLRKAVALEMFEDAQIAAADVDSSGSITAADARIILRAAAGLETVSGLPTRCGQIRENGIAEAEKERLSLTAVSEADIAVALSNGIGITGFDLVIDVQGADLKTLRDSKDYADLMAVDNVMAVAKNASEGFFCGYIKEYNWDRDAYEERADDLGESLSSSFDPASLELGTVVLTNVTAPTVTVTVSGLLYTFSGEKIPVRESLTVDGKTDPVALPGYIGLEQIDATHIAVKAYDYEGLRSFDLQLFPDEGITLDYPDVNPDEEQAELAKNTLSVEFNKEYKLAGYFREELWDTSSFIAAAAERGKTLSDDFDASRFTLAILPVRFSGVEEGQIRLLGDARKGNGNETVDYTLTVSASADQPDQPEPTEPTEPTENPHKPSLGKNAGYALAASTEGDTATVYVYFQNMVGLTAGDLTITYDPDVLTLTDLVKGADAALVKRVPGNFFDVEYNDQKGSVMVAFMFRDRLASTADFAESGVAIDGENFEAMVLTFKIKQATGFTSVFVEDKKGTYPSDGVQVSTGEPVHVHAFGDWTVSKAATCTEKGEEARTCDCGEKETRELAALGHQPQKSPRTPPTCAAPGKESDTVCSRCSAVLETGAAIPALPHTWDAGAVTVQPTTDKEGVRTFTCTVCKTTKTEAVEKLILADNAREKAEEVFAVKEQKAEDVLKNAGAGAEILKEDGKALQTGELVGSGMKLKKADGTEKVIIVKGDNDGDGKVTASDARNALRMAVNLPTDKGGQAWETEASLVNGGEKVTAKEARAILRGAVNLDNPTDWFKAA